MADRPILEGTLPSSPSIPIPGLEAGQGCLGGRWEGVWFGKGSKARVEPGPSTQRPHPLGYFHHPPCLFSAQDSFQIAVS